VTSLYNEIKSRFQRICEKEGLLSETVQVRAKVLTPEEAIGHPEAQDFPLQKGKERLMQAHFRDGTGQAFTDRFGDFDGTLDEVLHMSLKNNFRRAVFVSTMNGVLRHLGVARRTIHCRDQEPAQCGEALAQHLKQQAGITRVAQVGFQPRMVEFVSQGFSQRVLDLDPDNIGTRKFGVLVEGPEKAREVIHWADILLVTGTTLVNDTIQGFLGQKPVLFYGTTIAGAAALMGWDRFCDRAR